MGVENILSEMQRQLEEAKAALRLIADHQMSDTWDAADNLIHIARAAMERLGEENKWA